ncbi:rod shape-determining protein MreC [Hyphomonas sp.]|uniref:rod shape-determining protein MreC n=1 Tax=Hyphomonas sp. TaxID=87 RepID=UPI003298A4C9
MASASSRNPGYSRKAQYTVFTGYLIAGIGALIGAALLAVSLWKPGTFSGLRGAASDVAAPAAEGAAGARAEGQGLIETITGYVRAGSENAKLKNELELARIRLREAEAVAEENRRLRGLLDLRTEEMKPVAVARLIGSTAVSTRRFAYLGAGSDDGVRPGMPVRTARGVVGRVLETGGKSSRVLLLTDSESVLPVRRSTADGRRDVIAFAEGRGDGIIRIRLINLGINPLKEGDVFVTSGAGGFFSPGVAVAVVSEVLPDGALARMISDPAAADYVSVEPIWQPEAVAGAATPIESALGEDENPAE